MYVCSGVLKGKLSGHRPTLLLSAILYTVYLLLCASLSCLRVLGKVSLCAIAILM